MRVIRLKSISLTLTLNEYLMTYYYALIIPANNIPIINIVDCGFNMAIRNFVVLYTLKSTMLSCQNEDKGILNYNL